MKRFAFFSFGVLCLALSGLIGFHIGNQSAAANGNIVSAERFVLVDSVGNTRGEWIVRGKSSKFSLRSDNPHSAVDLTVFPAAGAKFVMKTPGSKIELEAGMTGTNAGFMRNDDSGHAYIQFQNTVENSYISLVNRSNASIRLLELGPNYYHKPRVLIGNPRRHIVDANGKRLVRQMNSIVVLGDTATVTVP